MKIENRIKSGTIMSSLKHGYAPSNIKELVDDFPFLGDSLGWVDLYSSRNRIAIFKDTNKDRFYVIYLFTEKHCYVIHISDNYLGCGLSNRYYEPLEDWTRGRDLPDGKCDIETWNEILFAIIGCELVQIN